MTSLSPLGGFLRRALGRMRAPSTGLPAPAAENVPPHFAVGMPFLEDTRFRAAYAAGKATGSWWDFDLEWRASVICWAALHGRSLEGDFVECGVHRGGYARMVAEYVDLGALPDRKFYLIDTFSGIPRRFREGRAALFDGVYDDCYDEVVRTFAPYPNARIIRGDIPDVLDQVRPSRVAFLSIDLNVAEPSVAALAHFWPLLTPGAAVVLDDYNFQFFADQRPALDAVAGQLGARILALPTGQGLIVKP